jgi:hypothetical protein
MSRTRTFSNQEGNISATRDVEDAPQPMRQELLDVIYLVAGQSRGRLNGDSFYLTVSQCLGVDASGRPWSGERQRMGRDLRNADWCRVYDVIGRLWLEFEREGLQETYRTEVNSVLAAYGVAWDLGQDGCLHRVLPAVAQAQVGAAFVELSAPRYAPALALFNNAKNSYDARPRNDRDACTNIFGALESVAKEKYAMPNETFGGVLTRVRQTQVLNPQIIGVLEGINTLRNRNFGHGMTMPFNLSSPEVDFTYISCIGGILLLTRIP